MNSHRCCQARAEEEKRPLSSLRRRTRGAAEWIVPSAILVIMPKCPACVAAYVIAATGLGISVSAAAHLRLLALISCLIALGFLTARHARALFKHLRV